MGVELKDRVEGWVAVAWTQFPGNMIGSNAVIVTSSAPNGMGVYKLKAKEVSGVVLQAADNPDFMISNVRACICPFVLCLLAHMYFVYAQL
jgi:hypothetical protein